MKLNAKYQNHLYDNKQRAVLQLRIDNYRQAQMLSTLDDSKDYVIEIKEVKSKRSIQQNSFLWAMLHELEMATEIGMLTWYMHALEDADAKPTYLVGNEELYNTMINTFRAMKPVGKRMIVDPNTGKEKEGIIYKCYPGSSKFNTKEMNKLIDIVLGYCAEHNIDTEVLQY